MTIYASYDEECPEVAKRDWHFSKMENRKNRRGNDKCRNRNDKCRSRKQQSHKFQKKKIIRTDIEGEFEGRERKAYVECLYESFKERMDRYGADDEFLGLSKGWWELYHVFFHNKENTIKVFLDGPWQTMLIAWHCPDFDRDMAVLEDDDEDLLSLPPRRHTHSNGFRCQCNKELCKLWRRRWYRHQRQLRH
jgi:hypothetical protein